MTQESYSIPASLLAEEAQSGSGTGTYVLPALPSTSALPVVSLSPAPGTPLDRNELLSISITDDEGLTRYGLIIALGGDVFMAHDGDAFRGRFAAHSTRTAIAGGYRLDVRPNGGWTVPPRVQVIAIDTHGQEAL